MSYAVGDLTRLLNPDAKADATVKPAVAASTSQKSKQQKSKKSKNTLNPATAQALLAASELLKEKGKQYRKRGEELVIPDSLVDAYEQAEAVLVNHAEEQLTAIESDASDDEDGGDVSSKSSWRKDSYAIFENDEDDDQQGKVVLSNELLNANDVRIEGVDDSDDEDVSLKSKKGAKKTQEAVEREARTVFLGNVPVTANDKMIKEFLEPAGQVESVRFRSVAFSDPKLPKKVAFAKKKFHEGRDSMNAYAVMKTREMAEKALSLTNTVLDGHHIRVDLATNSGKVDMYRSVFVGNLDFAISEETLYSYFSSCGDVEGVRVIRDPKLNIGKGFGFVTFANKFSVAEALKKNGTKMDGRKLRVTKVTSIGVDKDSVAYQTERAKRELEAKTQRKQDFIEARLNKRKRQLLGDDADIDEVKQDNKQRKIQGAFQKAYGQKRAEAGFSAKKPRHVARPGDGKLGGVLRPDAWMGQTARKGDTAGRKQHINKKKSSRK